MNGCIPEISADAVMLYEKLTQIKTGETITYIDLAKVIGRDVRNSGVLATARRKALKDDNIVFGTIRQVGLRRLAASEVVDNSAASFLSIQRATRRERGRLSSVDFSTLPQEKKIKHSASAAALAMIHEIAAPKQLKVLGAKTGDGMQKLSMIQAIDAIREAEGGI